MQSREPQRLADGVHSLVIDRHVVEVESRDIPVSRLEVEHPGDAPSRSIQVGIPFKVGPSAPESLGGVTVRMRVGAAAPGERDESSALLLAPNGEVAGPYRRIDIFLLLR